MVVARRLELVPATPVLTRAALSSRAPQPGEVLAWERRRGQPERLLPQTIGPKFSTTQASDRESGTEKQSGGRLP